MPLYQPPVRRAVSHMIYPQVGSAYVLTPLTAGTTEPVNVPGWRTIADLAACTQMRIVVGQRAIGAGGTSCDFRIQYSTNGATQTTFADAQATGTGLNMLTGTANTLRETGWADLVTAARVDGVYIRGVFVTVGTVTTAPTVVRTEVQFR